MTQPLGFGDLPTWRTQRPSFSFISPSQVWLPMLLSRFRFELVDVENMEVDSTGLHLKPKDGLKLRVFRIWHDSLSIMCCWAWLQVFVIPTAKNKTQRLAVDLTACCTVLACSALRSTMYSNCSAARYASHAPFWSLAKCSRGCFAAEWLQPSWNFHRFSEDLLLFLQPATTAAEGSWAQKMGGWLPLLRMEVMWDDMLQTLRRSGPRPGTFKTT